MFLEKTVADEMQWRARDWVWTWALIAFISRLNFCAS